MTALNMISQGIFPSEAFEVSLASFDRTDEDSSRFLSLVDFSNVSLKSGFVSELRVRTIWFLTAEGVVVGFG
jgi:hypothetical protein